MLKGKGRAGKGAVYVADSAPGTWTEARLDALCEQVRACRDTRMLAGIEAALSTADRPRVLSPSDVHRLTSPIFVGRVTEAVVVVSVANDLRVMGVDTVSEGGMGYAVLEPAVVFSTVIRRACTRFMLAHNHPSGDPTASTEDVRMTRELTRAAGMLRMELLDHVIWSSFAWYSMRGKGDM